MYSIKDRKIQHLARTNSIDTHAGSHGTFQPIEDTQSVSTDGCLVLDSINVTHLPSVLEVVAARQSYVLLQDADLSP